MKLNISKEDLEKLYNEELNDILEQCDWISYIDSHLVCRTITYALKRVGYDIDSKKLHEFYLSEIKSLNLKDNEWDLKFGQTDCISLVYDTIEKNF